jgi:glutamate racemase
VAQPLSALVEAGVLQGRELEREIEKIVAPLSDVPVLVSACTHYAAIRRQIEVMLPALHDWVEPAELATTALITARRVTVRGSEIAAEHLQPSARFLTSGHPNALRGAGLAAFGVRVTAVETLPV